MYSTAETLTQGMKCLTDGLGIVETERFISIVLREQTDYTKWRQQYFDSMSDDEIENEITSFAQKHPDAFVN